MTDIGRALQKFQELIARTPKPALRKEQALIKDICKTLHESLATPASSLVETLESAKIKRRIEAFVQRPAGEAVVRPVEVFDIDLRLLDVQHADAHNDDSTKFRKGLGERSLGLLYHEWQMSTIQCSRLDGLRQNLGSFNAGEGNMVDFIKAQGFPEMDFVHRSIRNGTRLLLLDHLYGADGASAVVFFASRKFRDVAYPDLKALADSMRANTCVAGLISKIGSWFKDCQAIYACQYKSHSNHLIEAYFL